MVLGAIILKNLLALAFLGLLAFIPVTSRVRVIILIAVCAAAYVGLMLSSLWIYPSAWTKYLYLILLLALSVRLILTRPDRARKGSWISIAALVVVAPVAVILLYQGVHGRLEPNSTFVDLASPLERDDGHCALSAGNTLGLNFHLALASDPSTLSEIHGVDFIKKRPIGVRTADRKAWHPKPRQPEHYAIFDEPVLAPCSGTVIASESQRPDVLSGAAYRDLNGSNFVALDCKGVAVILAHLKEGSVTATPGEPVAAGTVIGRVGNSGNTIEPHLHINAQTLTDGEILYEGSHPIAIRFDGRYLARGDCL